MLILLGFSLTFLIVVLVRSFSYTPHASFSEEFLLHPSFLIMVRSFTSLMLVLVRSSYTPDTSFFCTPRASFSEEFLLHSRC